MLVFAMVTRLPFSPRLQAVKGAFFKNKVAVQVPPFDVGFEYNRLQAVSRQVGAVTTFVGSVRDINDNESVSGLFLEHYPGMTEKEIEKIISEACQRWSVIAATVIHRVGSLKPGDEIVFVGVASEHRGDAFNACELIIDFLKTRATFWKNEQRAGGDQWLTTRDTDVDKAGEWSES